MAADLVASFEGFEASPYRDQAGIWTIGFGTIRIHGEPVTASTPTVTRDEALGLMMGELQPTAAKVFAACPAGATEGQKAACVSFAYNLGMSAFLGSTLLKVWKAWDVGGAADHFLDWVKYRDPASGELVVSAGLVRRRKAERAMFLGEEASS